MCELQLSLLALNHVNQKSKLQNTTTVLSDEELLRSYQPKPEMIKVQQNGTIGSHLVLVPSWLGIQSFSHLANSDFGQISGRQTVPFFISSWKHSSTCKLVQATTDL